MLAGMSHSHGGLTVTVMVKLTCTVMVIVTDMGRVC
jgi:hypothetical protein